MVREGKVYVYKGGKLIRIEHANGNIFKIVS